MALRSVVQENGRWESMTFFFHCRPVWPLSADLVLFRFFIVRLRSRKPSFWWGNGSIRSSTIRELRVSATLCFTFIWFPFFGFCGAVFRSAAFCFLRCYNKAQPRVPAEG